MSIYKIMEEYGNIIEKCRLDLFKAKINNEINYWSEPNYNKNLFNNINNFDIDSRLDILNAVNNAKLEAKYELTVREKRDILLNEVDSLIYKKQWKKLLPQHKINKVKEYIIEQYGTGTLQDAIIKEISAAINQNKLNAKRFITYDPNQEKILLMPCLSINIEKNEYKLKLV